ncbi:MAG: hypothetical protein K6U87_06975 [Firmicutes bacterium]|nr:hypothetical protein [Bacillota bacterium]
MFRIMVELAPARFEELGLAPGETLHLGWVHVRLDVARVPLEGWPGAEGEIVVARGGVEDDDGRIAWGWHAGWVPAEGARRPADGTPLDWLRALGWGCCTRCGFLDGLPCLCRREAADPPHSAGDLAQELWRIAPMVLGLQQHWVGLWHDVARRLGSAPPPQEWPWAPLRFVSPGGSAS